MMDWGSTYRLAKWACAPFLCLPLMAQGFCGFYAGKADASLFNEASQVIIARDGPRTVISMLNDYKGPLDQFALIVPTPQVITQGQVRIADKNSFERMDAYSAPRLVEYHDSDPCQLELSWGEPSLQQPIAFAPMPTASRAANDMALGVKVEAQYTLDEYDIVSLSAKQSDGLETWLLQNGYKIPKGTSSALKPYINQGMKFFVAKVNLIEQKKTGYSTLRPLQFAFESPKFMLPMRLGMLNAPQDKAQDLIVYVLTKNGRVESSNYRTNKIPSDVDIPTSVKPQFASFYQALFDRVTASNDYRVVFTEYFWNMAWCDPCAAPPLEAGELRKAGVFWLDGDDAGSFSAIRNNAGATQVRSSPYGSQPVMLTRLHIRYTPASFAEDLMFVQTADQQNFQARYVMHHPVEGSISSCAAHAAELSCAALCRPKVSRLSSQERQFAQGMYGSADRLTLTRQCEQACVDMKHNALARAQNYYEQELPARQINERRNLARLTGWSGIELEAVSHADAGKSAAAPTTPAPAVTWWQKLFGSK